MDEQYTILFSRFTMAAVKTDVEPVTLLLQINVGEKLDNPS
jgi:hypothetical protein